MNVIKQAITHLDSHIRLLRRHAGTQHESFLVSECAYRLGQIDTSTCAPTFNEVGKKKLDQLMADGYQIAGYAMHREGEQFCWIGEGGMVLWPRTEAMSSRERAMIASMRESLRDLVKITGIQPLRWHCPCGHLFDHQMLEASKCDFQCPSCGNRNELSLIPEGFIAPQPAAIGINKILLDALCKIAGVNAMDYEYQRWAREAVADASKLATTAISEQKSEQEEKLTAILRAFLDKHHVSCPECIHQSDRVIENAYGLIEELADVVGYYQYPEDEA